MAINVFTGKNIFIAKQSFDFADLGCNESNTSIIAKYKNGIVEGSWKPGRLINGISGLQTGETYRWISLIDWDLSEYLSPPVGGIGALTVS